MGEVVNILYGRRLRRDGPQDPHTRRIATLTAILQDTAELIEMVLANKAPNTREEDHEALAAQVEAIRELLEPERTAADA